MLKGWRGAVVASLVTALILFAIDAPPNHDAGTALQDEASSALAFLISPDMLLVYFTAALVGVGVLTYITFKEQAKIMAAQINLAQDEFNATHRPRIRVRAISYPVIRTDSPVEFRITLVNAGDNDAIVESVGVSALEHDGEAGYGIQLMPREDEQGTLLISGAHQTYWQQAQSRSTSSTWAAIEAGAHDFIVTGVIKYSDKVGVIRHTGFARVWDSKWGAYRRSKIYSDEEYED